VKPTVAVIRGDGIGPEVVEATLAVLEALDFEADWVEVEAGFASFERRGTPLPDATLAACRGAEAVLFGAVTTPPAAEDYPSPILHLRRELDLYANLRPVQTYAGLGRYGDDEVDVLIVRENTEGLYVQHGWRESDRAYNVLRRTRAACERIVRLACQRAGSRDGRLAIVHKANVVKPADVLWIETAREVTAHYDVEVTYEIVDALCTKLVLDPARFDVICAPNLYGDVLSDLLAGVAGGLGLCASANVGEAHALFEPVHGSAPDIAGRGVANPTAAFLSAGLLLDHFGLIDAATRLRRAVALTLADRVFPPDLGGRATTRAFTEAVVARLS